MDYSKTTLIRYERDDNMVRVSLRNVLNHELREVLVGLWARLPEADRVDHIRELTAYQTQEVSFISPVALTVLRAGEGDPWEIDVAELTRRGERVRP